MPASIWMLKIGSAAYQTFEALGLDDGTLSLVNQQADSLVLVESLASGVTPAELIAEGEEVALQRDGVTWFTGKRRGAPVRFDSQRTYTIVGPWNDLERRAYLQNFQAAADPEDANSTLVAVKRGRVVLGQNDAGLKINLTDFLTQVCTYAGVAIGQIDVPLTIPFADCTDLSCAEVIQNCLRWVPDTVVWWDYSVSPPQIHMRQRADLTATTLAMAEGVITSVSLTPRHDLVVDHVALFYVATNRSNSASWEVTLPLNGDGTRGDFYPPGTTGEEPGALVRTIQLAGSVVDRAWLTQEIVTRDIPDYLTDAALAAAGWQTAATNLTLFTSLSNWWKDKKPELKGTRVAIKGFRAGRRYPTTDPEGTPTEDLRELMEGGLTEWMQEDDEDLVVEDQIVEIAVAYELTDPNDATKKSRVKKTLSTTIRATNAQTKTYSQLQSTSVTPGEAVPTGLAEALYGALHTLPYDGEIVIEELDATAWPGPGAVVNISGDAAAYAAMDALVQRRVVELGAGRTTITVGPARQLGPDDLVEIFRGNRTRQPSTAYAVRATGKTGGGGGATSAPMPTKQPLEPQTGEAGGGTRVVNQALTVTGAAPTAAEITTAMEAAYPAGEIRGDGDVVNLTVGGVVKLRATVSLQGAASGIFVVAFVEDGVTYYANVTQTGLW